MNNTAQIAKHIRDVYFGGNWTTSNLRDNLKDVTLQQATTKVYSFNTIAVLFYHVHYYVREVTKVLQGEPLQASDKYSFDMPEIHNEHDWEEMKDKAWKEANTFADLVEKLPDSILGEYFTNEKYGTYFRNLHGIIEHTHYHLGQIALIKKLVLAEKG